MSCTHCRGVLISLLSELNALRRRVVLPGPREPLYDGENVGHALARGHAITERERVHVEGQIAALERVIVVLTLNAAPLRRTADDGRAPPAIFAAVGAVGYGNAHAGGVVDTVTIDYRCARCGDHSAQRITMDARRANDARACELCGAEMLREGGP